MAAAPAAAPRPWQRPLLRVAAPVLAATLLAAALLALAMGAPAPARVDVGAPGDAAYVANFYRAEGPPGATFRWSAPGARVLVPAAYDGALALELRLRAPGFAPADAPPLRVTRDGATVAALAAGPAPRVYRLLLPPDAAPEPAPVRLEPLGLEAAPAYGEGDPRPLGVALDALAVAPAPGAAAPPGPALARAALIAAALALAWLALTLARALPPSAALGGALIAAAGAGLALWAWRAPLGFAAAVPTPTPGALAAGLGLAAALRAAPPLARLARKYFLVAAFFALFFGVLLVVEFGPASGLGAALLALFPGALAAWLLLPDEHDPAALLFLGACGGVAVAAMLFLGLHALPGALPRPLAIGAPLLLAVAVVAAGERDDARSGRWFRPDPPAAEPASGWAGRLLALALLAGLALRLWQLGGAEFQGDEARAMLLAASVAGGADGALLTHTKGPVEALLPAAPLAMAGAGAEWAARLPFALASLGVLAGALALLRAWVADAGARPWAAALAVSLLAVDGFAVAFARIVQYQSVVMLMMLGALWCCWRFYQGDERPRRLLGLAAALLAVGLLAHYDAVMIAPALAWLVVAGGLRRGWGARGWALGLGLPALLGAALLASFFAPYVLGPSFAGTAEYLAGRAAQGDAGGPPFNNLPLYLAILGFYNAPPLVPLLVALVLGAAAALLVAHVRPRPLGAALAAALVAAAGAQWLAPGAYALPGGASWAGLAFGLPLLGLCAAPGVPAQVRAVAIWLTTALCAEAFLIAEPRTHFYTAHVPAALLVGLAVAAPAAPRLARAARLAALLASAAVLLGGGLYGQLVYLRQLPEYQRAFPAARPELLRAGYGDALPEAGYFGFPHRDGWKAVAELYARGLLWGSYDTNQNRWLAGWYMQGLAQQCKGQPDLYLIAEAEPTVYYPPEYELAAEIFVGPARAIAVYAPAAPAGGPSRYQLEDWAGWYAGRATPAFPTMPLLTEGAPRCR